LKHTDQPLQIEAMLFGQAGFLDITVGDDYYRCCSVNTSPESKIQPFQKETQARPNGASCGCALLIFQPSALRSSLHWSFREKYILQNFEVADAKSLRALFQSANRNIGKAITV